MTRIIEQIIGVFLLGGAKQMNKPTLYNEREFENVFSSTERKAKRVKISSKRQISIPKEFFEAMHFTNEAIIEFTGDSLVIKQVSDGAVDFSSEILKDLVEERGLSGSELLLEFNRIKQGLPFAIEKLKATAMQEPAVNVSSADYLASLLAHDKE